MYWIQYAGQDRQKQRISAHCSDVFTLQFCEFICKMFNFRCTTKKWTKIPRTMQSDKAVVSGLIADCSNYMSNVAVYLQTNSGAFNKRKIHQPETSGKCKIGVGETPKNSNVK